MPESIMVGGMDTNSLLSKYKQVFDFVEGCCSKYNIDESHGLKHSIGTVQWAFKLMDDYHDISDTECSIIIYAAALHDMCDSKYRSVEEGSNEICEWLLSNGVSLSVATAVIEIITSMSYSKLKLANKMQLISGDDLIYPDHGKWQRAYHIVRHADLLEAYKVVRCYLYSKRRCPLFTEEQIWAEVRAIFNERVFKYVSHRWIFLPTALKVVPQLVLEAQKTLDSRSLEYII